jgi:hypothetical protein
LALATATTASDARPTEIVYNDGYSPSSQLTIDENSLTYNQLLTTAQRALASAEGEQVNPSQVDIDLSAVEGTPLRFEILYARPQDLPGSSRTEYNAVLVSLSHAADAAKPYMTVFWGLGSFTHAGKVFDPALIQEAHVSFPFRAY